MMDSDEHREDRLRQMTCQLGQMLRPDGDTTLFMGDTCATVAVYGPGEVKMNKELLDKATVEVVYRSKSGLPGCAEKMIERLICNTYQTAILTQLHPRSSVSLTIQEIQNSGSFLACCINASCLALLDASVSMKFLVAAVSCIIDNDGNIVLDPNRKQEKTARSSLTFVFDNKDKKIVTINAKGDYRIEELNRCLALCKEASVAIFDFYRESMKKKLSKSMNTLKGDPES
ncbi:hypothetical protein FSP39_011141 [Pinctada imbricata]|uniref:Exosome complex component RRP46 n=1 Tax=Pinctada imbricata TaxID=66713 RepID=A0AA89BQK5_PINIB|nr:hypothetical protein FSP39_011141 [Pinctada imbricata]